MTTHEQPRIAIVTGGTRGDVQPSIVLGKGLQAAGYPVTIIAGRNFATWVESHQLGFADLGVDIQVAMESDEARAWKQSTQLTTFFHMKRFSQTIIDPVVQQLTTLLPNYDAVITGVTTFPIAAAVTNAVGIPLLHLLKQPMYPTRSGEASATPLRPHAYSWLNLLSRPLLLRGLWYAYGSGMRAACKRLGHPEATYRDFADTWLNTPTFVAVSPHMIPPPPDYPSHVHVTGFLFLDEATDWTPPPDLLEFLDSGAPPIYIGFGSMTGHQGDDSIAMLVAALDGQRGIIDGGWSARHTDMVPDSVYPADGPPHDWLFPRMGALVHHGGSGTTAAGLRAGVPMVVVPHLFDQFYFGRRIHELGVGTRPIPRHKLNAHALNNALTTLLTDDSLHTRVDTISRHIQAEAGVTNLVTLVDAYLGKK